MNRKYIAALIGQLYRDQAGDGTDGGGGGGGDQTPIVKPEDARTALADYVSDPESLKTMGDEDVVKLHGKVTAAQQKAIEAHQSKSQAERIEAAKSIKLEVPKDSKLVQTDIDRISAIVREKGLSKAEADILVAEANQTALAYETRMQASAKEQQEGWIKAIQDDPEIGGDNLAVTQKNAQRVIDTFMPSTKGADGKEVLHPMRVMLRETGFGNHPEVVKFLNRVGLAMGEDKGPNGGGPASGTKSAESILYGETKT